MRNLLSLVTLCLLVPTLLYAALTDTTAVTEAKKRFGPTGAIAKYKDKAETVWVYQVGVKSSECTIPFTVLGEGSTWERAFAAVPPSTIQGSYSGIITVATVAWDSVGIGSLTWYIDGKALVPEAIQFPTNLSYEAFIGWDTRTVTPGVHVICVNSKNNMGAIGKSGATVVLVDQTKPPINPTIRTYRVNY